MPRKRNKISLPWERRTRFSGLRSVKWRWLLAAALGLFLMVAFIKDGTQRQAHRQTTTTIDVTKRAVENFRKDIGRCPNSLVELLHPPILGARYLDKAPRDAWGRLIRVRCPGHFDKHTADVISAGPSGSFLNNDNIR